MAEDTEKRKAEQAADEAESDEPTAESDTGSEEPEAEGESEEPEAEVESEEPEADEPKAAADEPESDEPQSDEPQSDEPQAAADEPQSDEPQSDEPEADEPKAAADEPEADEPESDEPQAEPEATGVAAEVIAEVDAIDALELLETAGATLALARLVDRDVGHDRPAVAHAVVTALAARGVRAAPALYDARSWSELVLSGDGETRWLETLDPRSGLQRHVEILRGSRDFPVNARRVFLPRAREQLKVVAFTQRSPELPPELALSLAARVAADTAAAICALRGAPYPADDLPAVVSDTPFSVDDFALVAELEGLAVQVEHYQRMTLLDVAERVDWQAPLERLYNFARRFERYVVHTLSTEAERVRRKRLTWGGAAAAVVLVVVGGAWRYAATRPIPPLKDQSGVTDPGGIVGHYYLGRNYRKRVASRTDRRISFSTNRNPHPKVTRDNFSIRWEGYVRFTRAGKQLLCGESDDGNRVWLNDEKIVDDWHVHAKRRTCATVRVARGWYKLRVDYFDKVAGASMRLLRGRRRSALRVVPSRDLCCKGQDALTPPPPPPRPPRRPPLKAVPKLAPKAQPRPKTTPAPKKPAPKKPAPKKPAPKKAKPKPSKPAPKL